MAPFDRGAERLLAPVGIPSSLEQVEALRETLEDLGWRQNARSSRRQLHRERQVVETAAELGDRLVALESRAAAEEVDRVSLGERKDRVFDFSPDAQELTAGDDQSEIRTGFDQRGELWCCLDHLLEVVQQK